MAGSVVGAVGGIAGGLISSNASSNAADAQIEAAQDATDEQRRQFDLTRSDMAPWVNTGKAGLNRLAYLLGLSPYQTGVAAPLTRAQIRKQLLPQYTTTVTVPASGPGGYVTVYDGTGNDRDIGRKVWYGGEPTTRQDVNEAALNAAIDKQLAQQQAQRESALQSAESDPLYGSLTRKFSMQDYLEDPGYQFRLDQGEQAINRAAAAAGRYDSGRALKDLTQFNSGLASQEFGNAYNRWNNDMTNIYNRLAGIAGTGQTAVNNLATVGSNVADNISDLTTQEGNARASGYVGQGNAWNSALGGATNALSQYFTNKNQSKNNGGVTLYGLNVAGLNQ